MNEVAIMVAPNGARRMKTDHPAIPITPAELGVTAQACRLAGAGAIHVHVRDEAGRHALNATTYREAIRLIVDQCAGDMAVQVTTESAGLFGIDDQVALAQGLKAANLSFAIRELVAGGPGPAVEFLAWAAGAGVSIQFILYDVDDIAVFAQLHRSGNLRVAGKPRTLLVVGRYGAVQNGRPEDFETLYRTYAAEGLHESTIWMTCAFGIGEMACLSLAIERGGHARVGFENAIVDANGVPARDNAQRVAMVAELARRHGRPIASAAQTATILGMKSLAPFL